MTCGNKHCGATCQKGKENDWTKRKFEENLIWLCQKSTGAYCQKQYCGYCKQIYIDKSQVNATLDGLEWIQCNSCKSWRHVQCEARKGCSDIEVSLLDPKFIFRCSKCTKSTCFKKTNGKKNTN